MADPFTGKKARVDSAGASPDRASGPSGLAEKLLRARASLRPVGAQTAVMHPVEASVRIQQLEEMVDTGVNQSQGVAQDHLVAFKAESDRRLQAMAGQISALTEKHNKFEEKQNRLETA